MDTIKLETEVKVATSIREMVDPMTGKRRIGLVYYQRLSDGGLIARSLSEATDKNILKRGITERKIYLPVKIITAETT
ncbi:hypothetical protein [uncultured Algoriphagus sp.]|uniref:hypothetical protein n=1 Tax=uncultured Algoriphagus sp. TaxID=417365 RepID=UPI0025874F39|nr:hypothetical protein [uncultured Algoriphagus sp.]